LITLLNFLGLTGGSAVHRLSESSFSVRPQSQEKARSSRSDKGGIKLDTGTCPSGGGSHRSKGDDVSNKKSEMKISSKKASSGSHRYFIFATFFAFLALYDFIVFL
jgi:hypothetical protein